MAEAWQPKVEKRVHPFGSEGVNVSLEEVAKRVAVGYTNPKVRAWAIECLERARREEGIKVDTEKERAEILLKAVQKKLWVPDPVGAEWMAGAHLMACDQSTAEQACYLGNDCDDLTILLASCFMSVGLNAMIVGHAYDSSKNIGHVLTATRVGGRWMYADPSTDLPLGQCVQFTRERLLSAPTIKVLCDEDACLTNPREYDPNKHGFVTEGVFVGVDGVPQGPVFAWLAEPKIEWLGETKTPLMASREAVAQESTKRKGGLSRDDVGAYGAAGGGAAAAAACSATGAGAAAASACFAVGSAVGKVVVEVFYDIFSSGEDVEKIRRQQVAAWNRWQDVSDYVLSAQGVLNEAVASIKATYKKAYAETLGTDKDVFPPKTSDIIKALRDRGVPLRVEGGTPLPPVAWRPPCIVPGTKGQTDANCVVKSAQWKPEADRLKDEIGGWFTALERASTDVALDLAAQAAANVAAKTKNPIRIGGENSGENVAGGPVPKKTSPAVVVGGTAVAIGLLWWLFL